MQHLNKSHIQKKLSSLSSNFSEFILKIYQAGYLIPLILKLVGSIFIVQNGKLKQWLADLSKVTHKVSISQKSDFESLFENTR